MSRGARGRDTLSGPRGRNVLDGPRSRDVLEGGRGRTVATGPRGRVTGGASQYETGDAILLDPASTGYLLIDSVSGTDKLLIDF